ncbi:MAG: discoidin domain-containing protein, partial [Thiotrichaceae bacterium]
MNKFTSCFATVLITLFCFQSAHALVNESGSLETYLNDINYGTAEDNTWVKPNTTKVAQFKQVFGDFINHNYETAHQGATAIGYEVVKYTDTDVSASDIHYISREVPTATFTGGGTYVLFPNGKNAVLQTPHPKFDSNTAKQGIETYLSVRPHLLMLSGTRRDNSTATSSCTDGGFFDSDVAHQTQSLFFAAHQVASDADLKTDFIQFHGFGSSTLATLKTQCNSTNDKLVNISEGVNVATPETENSLLHLLRKNVAEGNTIDACVYGNDTTSLGGTWNVEGRYTNGSSDSCSTNATTSSKRFIHLEQSSDVRSQHRTDIANAIKQALLAREDIAKKYGIATQGTDSSYSYYSPASNAIDGNPSTYNHTSSITTENWWQLELPNPTLISKIMIQGRNSNTHRLSGAAVYISDTPYNGTLDENNRVATLAGNANEQVTEFTTAKSGAYLLVKASSTNNLHLATVEVFGALPTPPVFSKTDYTLGLAPNSVINSVVGEIKATDYQGDALTYSIAESVPFAIDDNGTITLTQAVNHNVVQSYNFTITASDGTHSATTNATVNMLNGHGVTLEKWTGVGGSYVSNLVSNPHYQNDPADEARIITEIDDYVATAPYATYGQRLTTLLKPTETGDYIFNLVADKRAELWFSEDSSSANLNKITATPTHSTTYQDWTDSNARQSQSIRLEAGNLYALQGLHKDG